MSAAPQDQIEEYLMGSGVGRDLRRDEVRWKYYDAEYNRGRERGFAWLSKGRVRGFIGWFPATLSTPAGDREMVWTCDWSVEESERNPGIGILLLSKVQKTYGFVGGVGGSGDTVSIVPRMRTRTVAGNAVPLRRPLRFRPLLEQVERKLRFGPRLSGTRLGAFPLPRRRRPGRLPGTRIQSGVDAAALAPLFDRPADGVCRIRYDAGHLAWLGRCPLAEFETFYLQQGSAAAGALLWRLHEQADRWRLVLRSTRDGETVLEAVIADVAERLSRTSANLVSTIVSSHDGTALTLLKRHGFIEAERWPLYIPELEGEGGCPEGFADMSYLDTDLAFLR